MSLTPVALEYAVADEEEEALFVERAPDSAAFLFSLASAEEPADFTVVLWSGSSEDNLIPGLSPLVVPGLKGGWAVEGVAVARPAL